MGGNSYQAGVGGVADDDDVTNPTGFGGGGGGGSAGAGGGAIQMTVGGLLQLDGTISAQGQSCGGNSGGAAGGSINVYCHTLNGIGTMNANGGHGDTGGGGGGGGGRIAMSCYTNTFSGTFTTAGGDGWTGQGNVGYGGAGTIYTIVREPVRAVTYVGQLLTDNGGNWGNITPLTQSNLISVIPDLTVQNGAFVTLDEPAISGIAPTEDYTTLQDLHVATQVRSSSSLDSALQLTVLGDTTIDKGGVITMNNNANPNGGLLQFTSYGTLTDNGTISANGNNDGGSLLVDSGALTGVGSLTASGGGPGGSIEAEYLRYVRVLSRHNLGHGQSQRHDHHHYPHFDADLSG